LLNFRPTNRNMLLKDRIGLLFCISSRLSNETFTTSGGLLNWSIQRQEERVNRKTVPENCDFSAEIWRYWNSYKTYKVNVCVGMCVTAVCLSICVSTWTDVIVQCQSNSCLCELAINLSIVMIGKQLINNTQEFLLPYVSFVLCLRMPGCCVHVWWVIRWQCRHC